MPNLNKIFLMGHVTRNPELRYSGAGTPVVNFGLAINHKWKGSDGEWKEQVCFVDIVGFGRMAEVIGEHFTKGDPIFIEGRLVFEKWEKDGEKKARHKVIAENFQFVGRTKATEMAFHGKDGEEGIDSEEIPF